MVSTYTKLNHTAYPDTLYREANGLRWLARYLPGDIRVPQVLEVDERKLVMTEIRRHHCGPEQWRRLGEGLAAMHRIARDYYGFEEDNYIGLSPQVNQSTGSWGHFFLEHRLRYQISRVRDDYIRGEFEGRLERVSRKLEAFLDGHCEQPSLVHGDLWHGNCLCDDAGDIWLIDPAVYFGDREVDIAMTQMFAGFAPTFYQGYESVLPLSEQYPVKRNIYNLYHFLNHYNLFGDAYLPACQEGFTLLGDL